MLKTFLGGNIWTKTYYLKLSRKIQKVNMWTSKKEIYDFSSSQKKEEFLKDILAMANSGFKGKKYIIFGVKEEIASKKIVGVSVEQVKDQATYQQIIRENIEPDIEFEMKMFRKDEHDLCCFIIDGSNRPYIIKKSFGNSNFALE